MASPHSRRIFSLTPTLLIVAGASWSLATYDIVFAQDREVLDSVESTDDAPLRGPSREFGTRYGGTWDVLMVAGSADGLDGDDPMPGRATVNYQTGHIALTIDGSPGEEIYGSKSISHVVSTSDESTTSYEIKFEKTTTTDTVDSTDKPEIRISMPEATRQIRIRLKSEEAAASKSSISLPVERPFSDRNSLIVQIGPALSQDSGDTTSSPSSLKQRLAGVWIDDLTADGEPPGLIGWSRTAPRIDDVVVVDNQVAEVYPYHSDEKHTPTVGNTHRRLIVIGENLRDVIDGGADVRSSSEFIDYTLDPTQDPQTNPGLHLARAQTQAVLAGASKSPEANTQLMQALERRMQGLADADGLLFVNASLRPKVTPGMQTLSVAGLSGVWPLIFANQQARLQFARYGDQVRNDSVPIFYPGDIAAVDVVFEEDIPFEQVGLRLLHRPVWSKDGEPGKEVAVLRAKKVSEEIAVDQTIFRSDPIHIVSNSLPLSRPPDDSDAFILSVLGDDQIFAQLLDPATAKVEPPVAIARIEYPSEELGDLWKRALRKVAECDKDQFDGDPTYALQESTRISRFVVGVLARYMWPSAYVAAELSGSDGRIEFNPSVSLWKGDHAAALLIRDEIVEALPEVQATFPSANDHDGEITKLKDWAISSGQAGSIALIRDYQATMTVSRLDENASHDYEFAGKSLLRRWKDSIERPLSEFFDNADAIRRQVRISDEDWDEWLLENLKAAAEIQHVSVWSALDRARSVDPCNLEELIVIAGQESGPIVARLLPRLVKKVTRPGSPPMQHWEPDKLARAFVERLSIGGKAVAALDEYAEIDDAYKAMAITLATAGAASIASAAGFSGTAAALLVAGDAAEIGYSTATELSRISKAAEFYDYAAGASLVLGDQVLVDAASRYQDPFLTVVGAIAGVPGIAVGLNDFRHFKNISEGKELVRAKGAAALTDLGSAPAAERQSTAAYYDDLFRRAATEPIDTLDETDKQALRAFEQFSRDAKLTPLPDRGPYIGLDEMLGTDFQRALDTDFDGLLPLDFRSQETQLTREAIDPLFDTGSSPNYANAGGPGITGPPVTVERGPMGTFRIRNKLDNTEFLVAEKHAIGEGSTTMVFKFADEAYENGVAKLTTTRGRAALLDEMGYQLIKEISDDSIDAPTIHAKYPIEQSILVPGRFTTADGKGSKDFTGGVLTIAEKAPKDFKNAPDALKLSDGTMTAGQAIAFDEATRKINARGYVWLDNKNDNYAFVQKEPGVDEWKVVILDTGGIVPMKDKSPQAAGQLQTAMANPSERVRAAYGFSPDGSRPAQLIAKGRKLHQFELAQNFDHLIDWDEINRVTGGGYNTLFNPFEVNKTLWFSPVNGVMYPKTAFLATHSEETLNSAKKLLREKYGQD